MGDAVVTSGLEILGAWTRPPDAVAWVALAAAVVLFARALFPNADARPASRLRFLTVAAFAAAFLSLGYIAHYLRGGPRIIDATSYFLQGRALSHGHFAWDVPDPSASFRGRFLLFQSDRIAGIFPPGYPLLLAAGFLVGAPLVIGPFLAAALVLATYALAREIAHDANEREKIARLAAVLSIVCVALRYHTADTMAHAASALGITMALAALLRARRIGNPALFAVVGVATGYVIATRPVSAMPILLIAIAIALASPAVRERRAKSLALFALGMGPGVLLLLAANHAAAGSAFSSTQRVYYATSDGPPDCFRYGFGAGVGCLFEHGDFVRARLSAGFGLLEAAGTTVRRLRMHLTDVANLEPLALLVLLPIRNRLGKSRAPAIALAVVAGQVLAYAPFYFDGNYPGGGARLFADVLPIEHALVALAVAMLLPRIAFERRAFALVALSAAGFAVHAVHDQIKLAERDGGRPMFEPDRLREANVTDGLLYVETDNGFNLAHDPGVLASHGIVAARLRNDDHDRLLYDGLGHPPAHLYRLDEFGVPTVTRFIPQSPPGLDSEYRFEAESDWPPIAQSGGWAEPIWASGTCASGSRALALIPAPGATSATARIELPVPRSGKWLLRARAFRRNRAKGTGTLKLVDQSEKLIAEWPFPPAQSTAATEGGECIDMSERLLELVAPRAYLVLETRGDGLSGEIALDRTTMTLKEGR